MDKAPVGLWFVSEVPGMMAGVSVSVMLTATKSLAGGAVSGPRTCGLVRTLAELSKVGVLSEDRCSASVDV